MFSCGGAPGEVLGGAGRPCRTHMGMLGPVQRQELHAQRMSDQPMVQLLGSERRCAQWDRVATRVDEYTPTTHLDMNHECEFI